MRHPFPGPGIAVRILGEVTPERVEIVRKADHIFISAIREAGFYNEVWIRPMKFRRIILLTRSRSRKLTLHLTPAEVCDMSN